MKVYNVTKKDLERTEKIRIAQAVAFYASHPFATKVYLCLKLSMPMQFVKKHWETIIGEK